MEYANKKSKGRKAFTLVELIAVVVILGIIAGTAMLMFNPNNTVRLAQAGSYFTSVIDYAREEAIRRQTIDYVNFTPGSDYIRAAYIDSVTGWTYLPHPLESGSFVEHISDSLDSSVKISGVSLSSYYTYYVFFNSFGEPVSWNSTSSTYSSMSSGNYIYLTCGDKHLYMRIMPITGKVVTAVNYADLP